MATSKAQAAVLVQAEQPLVGHVDSDGVERAVHLAQLDRGRRRPTRRSVTRRARGVDLARAAGRVSTWNGSTDGGQLEAQVHGGVAWLPSHVRPDRAVVR